MSQQQFQEFQSQVNLLSPEQLKKLQQEIRQQLEGKSEPLIDEEERQMILSLFR